MTCDVLFSLALCANRSFSSSTCRSAAQAQCFGRLRVLVAAPGVVALRCPAWQARDSVCAGALSYNQLVLASLKHVKIGRHHSGATVPC